ncbi:acetyltransferase [Micromonospora craterilacus]|uniref:Acetyltransferase n=1 Tax=Micromonospora craterilacus TaxID=1655439 RepID=A0A2W2DTM0_9ACTN|nr:acetyltransferase [Micromonospora craterilacus]PZG15286.1 acetyltransferase [Micromonospora craterilacus]
MTDLVVRPLVAGEEELFDSMPDPLPQLRQVGYADGLAGGGYRPDRTWIALRAGRVVGRAAWALPPGSVGEPWLERFDLAAAPEDGAALLHAAHQALGGPKVYHAALPAYWRRQPEVRAVVEPPMAAARLAGLVEQGERLRCSWTGGPLPASAGGPLPASAGRYSFRPATDAAEINSLVARIVAPELLTGAETARVVGGVDLARDPLAWLTGPAQDWRVALDGAVPVGLAATAGDACYPMIAYLGLLDESARGELLADAVGTLAAGGAYEVVADVDAHRVATVAELDRTGFRRIRSRVTFALPQA